MQIEQAKSLFVLVQNPMKQVFGSSPVTGTKDSWSYWASYF